VALFTRDDLQSLLARHEPPCVSILMPTHRHRPDSEQDPIRYKNLLKRAEALLAGRVPAREARETLAPLADLADAWFWERQLDGLAVFVSADLAVHHRLPQRLPELAVVADSFHVKPMLRFLQSNQRYHVLSLSQKAVSLYEGTPFSLAPLDLGGLPGSLAEALGVERRERFLNVRTAGAGRAPVYHGHGAPDASKKEDLHRFFRLVDRALWELLRDDPAPLVLAGVGYYLPLYAEASRCAHIVEGGVEGNFDAAAPEQLHARAWPLVERVLRAREDAAVAEHQAAVARGLSTDDLGRVARAAVQGRVRLLLLGEGVHAWGRLDPESGALRLAEEQQGPHDDDALDDLAEAVLGRGGEVMQLPLGRMPGGRAAAALLRW
jgi:hypothetical protein